MGQPFLKQPAPAAADQSDILRQELELVRAREELTKLRTDLIDKLEHVSKLTRDEAKEEILKQVDKELDEEISLRIRQSRERVKQDAEAKAREILADAMKHGVVDITAEYTISTVKLPDDSVKGRIIGQGGRNIRAFEHATGVDVDLDETPGEIRLSSFDSIRREVARVAPSNSSKTAASSPAGSKNWLPKPAATSTTKFSKPVKNLPKTSRSITFPPNFWKSWVVLNSASVTART